MIIQHQGKLTIKNIERISGEGSVLSNFYYTDRYPTLRAWWARPRNILREALDHFSGQQMKDEFELNHRMHGREIAKLFGTPNCNMKGYESYPGAWVFYDTVSNVRWLVFSDGIRKNPFKGTSYEVTIPDDFTEDQFKEAIRKFFLHFGCIPLDENKAEL
jgi:hypothetical protein